MFHCLYPQNYCGRLLKTVYDACLQGPPKSANVSLPAILETAVLPGASPETERPAPVLFSKVGMARAQPIPVPDLVPRVRAARPQLLLLHPIWQQLGGLSQKIPKLSVQGSRSSPLVTSQVYLGVLSLLSLDSSQGTSSLPSPLPTPASGKSTLLPTSHQAT